MPLTFILMSGHARMFLMSKPASDPTVLARPDAALTRKRRLTAMRLQEIEGNPLTPDEIAMFEMFEREAWPHERRRAYLLAKARPLAAE